MSRLKRYAWSLLAAAIGALIVFLYLQQDLGWEKAFDKGYFMYLVVGIVVFVPQVLYDWKRYWRHGSKLDEMEKAILEKARFAALFTDYFYFVTVLLVIWGLYDESGEEYFRVSNFHYIIVGAIYVLLTSQAIATLILYGREPKEIADAE